MKIHLENVYSGSINKAEPLLKIQFIIKAQFHFKKNIQRKNKTCLISLSINGHNAFANQLSQPYSIKCKLSTYSHTNKPILSVTLTQ